MEQDLHICQTYLYTFTTICMIIPQVHFAQQEGFYYNNMWIIIEPTTHKPDNHLINLLEYLVDIFTTVMIIDLKMLTRLNASINAMI